MHNWEYDPYASKDPKHLNLIIFATACTLAVTLFLIFHPQIDRINHESPLLLNVMFLPALAIGFLYGVRITSKAVRPSETRSPIKRSIVKIFLFFFVIGGLFSSVSFALNNGTVSQGMSIPEHGLIEWVISYITNNGGATFLIITSITLMAAATKRLIALGGSMNKVFTFVGAFIFFFMLALSFTQSDPTHSEVYLFTFYQAGVVGGALFEMNRLTKHHNHWEDYQNGY